MVACPSVDQTTLGDNITFDFVIPRRKISKPEVPVYQLILREGTSC